MPLLFLVAIAAALVHGAVVIAGPQGRYYPATSVSVLAFFVIIVAVPGARPHKDLISPRNVALAFWGLVLVVMPVTINFVTPTRGTLPGLPRSSAIDLAMLLNALAFLVFSAGLQWSHTRRPSRRRRGMAYGPLTALVYIAVGLGGVLARVGDLEVLVQYFQGRGDAYKFNELTGTRGVLSIVLPPFLTFGCVILMEQWRKAGRLSVVKIMITIPIALAPLTLYSYNRGAVVVPAVALLAALCLFGGRRRTVVVVMVIIALTGVAFVLGNVRRDIMVTQGGRISMAELGPYGGPPPTFVETLQVYSQSPQFAGFALGHRPAQRYPGDLLVSSMLSPVPALGRPFRPFTGSAAYNTAIYANYSTRDQIVPLSVETWWSLGLAGVLVVFSFFGALVGKVHRRFVDSRSLVEAFSLMVLGAWLAAVPIVSLLVVSQILVYFFWAPLGLLVLGSLAAPKVAGEAGAAVPPASWGKTFATR